MKEAFRMVCSKGTSFLDRSEMRQLAAEAVRHVQKFEPKEAVYILNDTRGLKVVVRWARREVWIMSNEEAMIGGLPSPLDN